MSRDPRKDRARKRRRSPYARIRAAALAGRGVRLAADEVADLYDLDQSIKTRADLDAAGLDNDDDAD